MSSNCVVSIKTANNTKGVSRLYVQTSFHPDFPHKARNLGGTWLPDSKEWVFNVKDEQRVRDLCASIWGTDGETTDRCAVRVKVGGDFLDGAVDDIWLFGRQLVRRRHRDFPVLLGEDVVIIDGDFPPRGGSAAHPTVLPYRTTDVVTLEVRDVSKALADTAIADHPESVAAVMEFCHE